MYLTLLGTLFCAMVDPLRGAGQYQPPRALGVPVLAQFIDEIIRRDVLRLPIQPVFSHVELGRSFSGSLAFPWNRQGFAEFV
jgi:hypothetical protein